MATPTPSLEDCGQAYERGIQTFARLFSNWMDSNNWSYPVMSSLANACLGGNSWLHSSQISTFRHGTTRNPGPRTFVGIERLNYYVWRYQQERALIPGTTSSNHYAHAVPITEDGAPPSLGWFVEVFCGYRIPKEYDLGRVVIPEGKAETYSRALGKYLRQLIVSKGLDVVEDLPRLLHHHYPSKEQHRLSRITSLVLTGEPFSVEVLRDELIRLPQLTQALDGPTTEAELLEEIRK